MDVEKMTMMIGQNYYFVNVNVTDTTLWQGHHDRVMQLNLHYYFVSGSYGSVAVRS